MRPPLPRFYSLRGTYLQDTAGGSPLSGREAHRCRNQATRVLGGRQTIRPSSGLRRQRTEAFPATRRRYRLTRFPMSSAERTPLRGGAPRQRLTAPDPQPAGQGAQSYQVWRSSNSGDSLHHLALRHRDAGTDIYRPLHFALQQRHKGRSDVSDV